MNTIPYVIEKTAAGERSYDIFSRLLKDRIIMIGSEFNDDLANRVTAQLLFLSAEDNEKDISIYINSPGGSTSAGYAILDTMDYVKPAVRTICVGMAASMGAILLAGGTKGKRYALKNSEIMIHQPLGGVKGQATDMEISAKRIIKLREKIEHFFHERTGQPIEKLKADMERDYFMDADEAKAYGVIDAVL